MQHRQLTQIANTLPARKMPFHRRQTVDLKSARLIGRGTANRHHSARGLHAVDGRHAEVTDIRPGVRAEFQFELGSEDGLAVYYAAQEEAARRIAHRLHDESAQMLATVYLELADIARDSPVATVQKIDRVVKQLDGVCEQLRGLSHELRPPILEQLGLMPALESLANCVRKRSGLKLVLVGSVPRLPLSIETALYRVIQEALSNVVRHAGAVEAEIRLGVDDGRVCCTVSDDGTGLKHPDRRTGPVHGLGLLGIHERVIALKGQCRIVSRPNRGMQLKVEIPL